MSSVAFTLLDGPWPPTSVASDGSSLPALPAGDPPHAADSPRSKSRAGASPTEARIARWPEGRRVAEAATALEAHVFGPGRDSLVGWIWDERQLGLGFDGY